jgi:hypothetical protein
MSALRASSLALVVALCGCGAVPEDLVPDAGPDAPPPPGTTSYRGTLAVSPLVTFGGTPYCRYTVRLSEIEIDLDLLTTGQVKGGTSQALAVETRLASTTPACTAGPGIAPNIHKFTFKSSRAVANGFAVVMSGDPANQPTTSLTFTLTPAAGAFTAAARWARSGGAAPILNWVATSNLTLTVKP